MARTILFEIEVQNVGAARRIEALREEIRRLNKEIRGAEIGSPVFNQLIAKLTDAKQETAKLVAEQKALNREFQAARFPKDSLAGLRIEYAKLTEQIKILSAAQRASPFGKDLIANAARVKKEIDAIEQSLGRFTGNVGNYRSAFASLSQILTGGLIGGGLVVTINELAQSVTKAIALNRQLSDSLADVTKTTSLTNEQAQDLIKTLEARGSRTSIFDQLNIAAIGGQLGIVDEQIANFTAGVDVLNVALGDQFGSVDILTREFAGLRNVLTDFKTEDTADDILKLGNAVNFLEAQGNATGAAIVDFAGRLAGAGVPLGITTEKIIGLSTTLAELAINPERGATAVNRLLQEVARTPDLFAKAIGEPTAKFRKLVETDLLGAVALVSERISKGAASNVQFAQTLEALGIGSQGAIEVFGKLGGNIELLNTRIGQSGEQLLKTDSIYREFEKRNNNAEAAVAKFQNRLVALATSETAEGIIKGVAEALTDFVDILAKAPEFIEENKDELIALGFVLLSFTRTAQTAVVSTSAMTASQLSWTVALRAGAAAQTLAAVATRAWTAALNASPLILLTAAIYGAVKAFEAYENSASASEKATRAVADAQEEIAEQSASEVAAVERNIAVLKDQTATREEQKKAIDELIKINPKYLEGIDLEKASVAELTEIQKGLTDEIIRSAAERAKAAAQEEVLTEIIAKRLRIREVEKDARAASARETLKFAGGTGFDLEEAQRRILAGLRDELNDLQAEFDETGKKFDEAFDLRAGRKKANVLTAAEQDAIDLRRQFDESFDLKLRFEGEDALTAAEQDALDLKRQFEESGKAVTSFGKEAEGAGDKIQGLGGKTKKLKEESDPVAGSLAFLRAEVARLNKLIEETPGDPALLKPIIEQLKTAERQLDALEEKIKELKGLRVEVAPTIQEVEVQTRAQGFEAPPDTSKKDDSADARAAIVEDNFAILDNEEWTNEQILQSEKDLSDAARELRAKELAEEEAAAIRRKELAQEIADAAIGAAQNIADATFQIERNSIEQERDERLQAIDDEFEGRIAAAKGNEPKIAALQKEQAKRREEIEKEAARKRKDIAIKEAIIQGALAVIEALPNPVAAVAAGVAALAQIAIIRSQEFAEGGTVKRLPTGKVRERQNAPRTAKGDTVLAYLAPGEMVLNEPQQNTIRSLFGKDAFALAGVPGEGSTVRQKIPAFQTGGVVGVVPQNGFAQNLAQTLAVKVETEFTQEQTEQIGVTIGAILAPILGNAVREGTILGGDENNRLAERQARAAQNRTG